jgi:RNA polymerase sigma factor (sigma-70 family)
MTVNQTVSDETMDGLVVAAKTSSDAFGQLFDQFYPSIFAYCVRRLVLRTVAEDITSEVFLRVAGNIREFPGTREEDFCRWLFRIANNEINAHLRQSIRRRELLEAAVHLGQIDASISTKLLETDWPVSWERVYRELQELSDREQSIISLRFFAGQKHEQIAEVLEMKPGSVRVALSRALDKLRGRLRIPDTMSQSTPGNGASEND